MSLELLCKNNVLEIIHVPTINSWEHNCPRGLTIKFFQLQDSTEEDCQLVENLVIPEALKQKLQVLRRAQDLFAYKSNSCWFACHFRLVSVMYFQLFIIFYSLLKH